MSVADSTTSGPATWASAGSRAASDQARLVQLRKLATKDLVRARQEAWQWFHDLQKPSNHHRLHWLFEQGSAPESPHGDCEGMVMQLYGTLWLDGVDRLVRLGQSLGGIGWTGKSFDAIKGTGYNRLTTTARIPALLAMPSYRFDRINGELIGFRFHHALETSPVPPGTAVRVIKYDAPEFKNPLVLPRTRDELVEILPAVYLGRALLSEGGRWRVVGYFGLRAPSQASS